MDNFWQRGGAVKLDDAQAWDLWWEVRLGARLLFTRFCYLRDKEWGPPRWCTSSWLRKKRIDQQGESTC